MQLIYLNETKGNYFDKAWEIYLNSFPREERRTLEEHKKILKNDAYKASCYLDGNKLIAIVFYWHIKGYTFLEHFAVDNQLRGKSYGSKVLNEFIKSNENIVLEIEPIKDEISQRRLNFYERFGFVLNEYTHYQIPFRKEDKKLELLLMTYQNRLKEEEYKFLYEQMQKTLIF